MLLIFLNIYIYYIKLFIFKPFKKNFLKEKISFKMNFSNDMTSTNVSLDCKSEIYSVALFFNCYFNLISNHVMAIFELFLIFSTIFLNFFVIAIIFSHRSPKTIYDIIIIGHSISNLLSGLLIMPFFQIQETFDFWAIGRLSSMLWVSLDKTITTVTNLHMLYMSYVRLRSIISPKQYTKELLIKHPLVMIICFWVFSLSFWVTCSFVFKTKELTSHIDYEPHYLQSIINFFVWLLPLICVFSISIYILVLLTQVSKNHPGSRKSVVKLLLNPKSKFTIIIFSYLIQWSVPAFYIVIEPFLITVYDETLTLSLKWTSYTVKTKEF